MTSTPPSTPRQEEPASTSDPAVIAHRVTSLAATVNRPLMLGISGFGGAGKSTLAQALLELMPGSQVVPGDQFLLSRPPTARSDDWASVDRERLRTQVMLPIRRGQAPHYQVYDWAAGALGGWLAVTGSPVIVEGLGLFHPDIVGHFDLRVWIDVDLDTATSWGMERDKTVYDNPQTQLWEEVWKPNDADFFRRFRPDRAADVWYVPGGEAPPPRDVPSTHEARVPATCLSGVLEDERMVDEHVDGAQSWRLHGWRSVTGWRTREWWRS